MSPISAEPNTHFFTIDEFKELLERGILMIDENEQKTLEDQIAKFYFLYKEKAELTPMVGVTDESNGLRFYFTSMENLLGKYH